jgi:hypothetical protein
MTKIERKAIDMTGKKIGKITVLYLHSYSVHSHGHEKKKTTKSPKWFCQCQCGHEFIISESRLRSPKYKGCCLRCASDYKKLNGRMSYRYFSRIQFYAKERGIPYSPDITREFLWNLFLQQDRKCALSGMPLHFANTKEEDRRGGTSASLDRIDNTKGYTCDNVQWVHKTLNRMKLDFDRNRFYQICHMVNNRLNEG